MSKFNNNNWIKSLTVVGLMIVVLLVVTVVYEQPMVNSQTQSQSVTDKYVFPHNEVIDVNITIDEEDWADMVENALDEEMVMADITYNGYTLKQVGIRPKGNSSLSSVASSDSERFSLKVDFNYYVSGQNLFGLTKINLNNMFADTTMMKEYLAYESLSSLGADAPRTTFAALYVNGEYFGLYISVEQVNQAFLDEHFDNATGDLYKPDMGTGADLAYISDDPDDYLGLYPENTTKPDDDALIELISTIDDVVTGDKDAIDDLDDIFNVDSFLKYLAVSTVTVHLDSYQGGMYHNYYLYLNDDQFEWIAWDLNMAFNGFMGSNDPAVAAAFLIDEPVSGSMDNYPLVKAVLSNEEYLEQYHEYLQELLDGYFSAEQFEAKVTETAAMIDSYVEDDPTKFGTCEAFQSSTATDLIDFIALRSDNIQQQLEGTIPSTNNGDGNATQGRPGMGGAAVPAGAGDRTILNAVARDQFGGGGGRGGMGVENPREQAIASAQQEKQETEDAATSPKGLIGLGLMALIMTGTGIIIGRKMM